MKTINFLLILLCYSGYTAIGQEAPISVGDTHLKDVPATFAEAGPISYEKENYIFFRFDQSCEGPKEFSLYNCYGLKDSSGNIIKYKDRIQLFNLLASQGWHFKEAISDVRGFEGNISTRTSFIFENKNLVSP